MIYEPPPIRHPRLLRSCLAGFSPLGLLGTFLGGLAVVAYVVALAWVYYGLLEPQKTPGSPPGLQYLPAEPAATTSPAHP